MKHLAYIAALLLLGCSNDQTAPNEPVASYPASSISDNLGAETPASGNNNVQSAANDPSAEDDGGGIVVGTQANSQSTASESSSLFAVDPDSLSFPVVFHLAKSGVWKTEDDLKPVIAEIQRILAQAQIEILPIYTQDETLSQLLDVSYVPSIPDHPDTNGISFDNAALEVIVRDQVSLTQVEDNRPPQAPAVRTIRDAKPGELITVNQSAANVARTTARSICNQLGISARNNSTNLLASGTTGWTLNDQEISTVRATAVTKFGATFVALIGADGQAASASAP